MKRGWRIAGGIAFGALFLVVLGAVTMTLWNWLVPILFAGPAITFWQALGLLALSKILFSGWGKGSCGSHHGHDNSHWKNKFYQKFSNLTPDEREALKQKMKDKWCGRGSSSSTNSQDSNV